MRFFYSFYICCCQIISNNNNFLPQLSHNRFKPLPIFFCKTDLQWKLLENFSPNLHKIPEVLRLVNSLPSKLYFPSLKIAEAAQSKANFTSLVSNCVFQQIQCLFCFWKSGGANPPSSPISKCLYQNFFQYFLLNFKNFIAQNQIFRKCLFLRNYHKFLNI